MVLKKELAKTGDCGTNISPKTEGTERTAYNREQGRLPTDRTPLHVDDIARKSLCIFSAWSCRYK